MDEQPATSPAPGPGTGQGSIPTHNAKILLGGGDRAIIVHENNQYLLRVTRNGKLILTK
ncbi:MAG: hemin uptake protein HemP [Immundisolibacteraceae bacterium]|nr:hemin uptake protein HemP [Immundisolibacteraceae bacterium]